MSRVANRFVAGLLIVAAAAGILFSIAGLLLSGRAEQQTAAFSDRQLAGLDEALTSAQQGFDLADTSLRQVQDTLKGLNETVATTSKTMEDIVPSVEAMRDVVGERLPETLESAQESLTSFGRTAGVVDALMSTLSSIRLLGLPEYDPAQSLSQGVERLAADLAEMPQGLSDISGGLEQTAANLEEMRGEMAGVATSMSGLAGSVDDTRDVIGDYREIVDDLKSQVASAQERIPRWLRLARLGFSVVLVWLGIASLGLLMQGWEMWAVRRVR